jgi:hypothetical protein
LGVIGAAFIATLASSRTEVRGESPSYRRINVCRSGFSCDLYVVENQRLGVAGAASAATFATLAGSKPKRGAKAPPE